MATEGTFDLSRAERLRLRPVTHSRDIDLQKRLEHTSVRTRVVRVASLLRHAVLPVYRLEGHSDGDSLRVVVADDGSTLSYVRGLIFDEPVSITRLGSISPLNPTTLDRFDADITVAGANLLAAERYLPLGFHLIPKWVRLFLPVDGHPDSMLEHRSRETRKYFRRLTNSIADFGYSYDVVTDDSWFEGFYRDMYRPYAIRRYGRLAVVHSYREVRKRFNSGAGVVILKQGVPVGAAIVCPRNDMLWVPHMGVANGDISIARSSMTAAMDYFIVELADRLGYSMINYGHARPFLSDGVLRYKLTWHMQVKDDDDGIGVFAFRPSPASRAAAQFLEQNSFYELRDGNLSLSTHYSGT